MSDSIFPFIDSQDTAEITSQELPIPREYAWDFETGDFKLEDGKFIVVEGLEALKIWIYKALITARYRWPIYSWNYGCELDNLVGSSYSQAVTQSEAKRYVEECLLINPYIKAIKNVQTDSKDEKLTITFTAVTDYGEVTVSV
jgi:hypothetical protein